MIRCFRCSRDGSETVQLTGHRRADGFVYACVDALACHAASPTAADVIGAAVSRLTGAILDAVQADPHQWSERGCATCRAVSSLAGRDFGCYAYAKARAGGAPAGGGR